MVFGDKDEICPFLQFVRPGFYRCRLIEIESVSGLDPIIRNALGVGVGCTNEERQEATA
jgi:hypothetical protein